MNYILLLVLLSPFTAWLTLVYFAYDGIKNKYRVTWTPVNVCLLMLVILSTLSGILNGDFLSIGGAMVFAAFIGMNTWMENRVPSIKKLEMVLNRFWHLGLFTGVLGVFEKAASHFWDMSWYAKLFFNPTYFPTKETYRTMATFGNPNIAGDWFAILALISFYLMEKESSDPRASKKYRLGAILFTANLMFTGSKGALIAFVVGIIFYCVLKKSKQLWHQLSILMVFIGGILFLSFDLFDSMNFRNDIWRRCFQMISEKPWFGSGFWGIYDRMGEPHAHNIWISITTSLGFFGLLILMVFSYFVLKESVQIIRAKMSMSRLSLSILAILFVHGIVDFTLLAPQTSVLFFGTVQFIHLLSRQTSAYKLKQPRVYRVKKQMASKSIGHKIHSKLS